MLILKKLSWTFELIFRPFSWWLRNRSVITFYSICELSKYQKANERINLGFLNPITAFLFRHKTNDREFDL